MPDPIAKLRDLLEAATSGPWSADTSDSLPGVAVDFGGHPFFIADTNAGMPGREDEANARLIAALRNAAPELLAVAEEAKRRLDAGHNDTCDRFWSSVRLCSCGASGLLAATEALDAKLDEVTR